MHYAIIFVLLLSFIFGLGLLARRLAIPYPILFVMGGLFIGFIPDLPTLRLDPDFIFFIFLPPLLYIQAFYTSWRDFRRELRPIALLAIGLVFVTTVTVAYAAHWMIPDFPLAAGFVLGAIISPPDAIAASAIAQRLGLPRRVVTIIEGESLVNDSTSLVIFRVALAAVGMNGGLSFIGRAWLPGEFLAVSAGGIAVGLAVGWLLRHVRQSIMNEGSQIALTVSLLTPFVSYLAGEVTHVSSVLAVVSTGLYLGWEAPGFLTSAVRLQAQAVWEIIVYLLNGFVFVLIGLQLPGILGGMQEHWWARPFFYAVVINLVCILVRIVWVFTGAYLLRLIKHIRQNEPRPDPRHIFIISWCGMRGVVSLAAALVLNAYPDFPRGHLVQFIAFSVILTTLVLQGLTLPFFIRLLGVDDDGTAAREERAARTRMLEAVLGKIAEERREEKYPTPALDNLEQIYRERTRALQDDLAGQLGWSDRLYYQLSLWRLQRVMILAQRDVLLALRREGIIGDDVLHKIERELDIEDVQLKAETGKI
ncbi:MAG TPA: Na+/H+ antiporter [Candidatus Methylacidiphilales bacterium]|nr:Na+/H+ antiporter [Candidatus Methylacidiphilales bacterium]